MREPEKGLAVCGWAGQGGSWEASVAVPWGVRQDQLLSTGQSKELEARGAAR